MESLVVEGSPANSAKEKQKQNEQQIREQKLKELDFIIESNTVIFQNLSNLIKSSPMFLIKHKDIDIQNPDINIDELIKEFILSYRYADGNIPDKFFDEKTDLYVWYKTKKNPEFKKLSDLPDLSMPEYRQLLATITLNLFKTLIELKFPGRRKNLENNKYNNRERYSINYSLEYYGRQLERYTNKQLSEQNRNSTYENKALFTEYNDSSTEYNDSSTEYAMLISLLDEISILNITDEKKNNWSYKEIMGIYLTYIAYMSGIFIKNIGFINDKKIDDVDDVDETHAAKKLCVAYINYCHQIYKNTPFILFPTFVQLNEIKVIRTLSAPIINFYITYTRTMSHENILPPCYHIDHDIRFHGTITHFHILMQRPLEYKYMSIEDFMILVEKPININVNIENIYDTLNILFTNLITNLKLDTPENKNIISLLFELFHEDIEQIIFIFKNGFENINLILKNMVDCVIDMIEVVDYKKNKQIEHISQNVKLSINNKESKIDSTTIYYDKKKSVFFNKEQQNKLQEFLITIFSDNFLKTRDKRTLNEYLSSRLQSKRTRTISNGGRSHHRRTHHRPTHHRRIHGNSRGSFMNTNGRGSKKSTYGTRRGSNHLHPSRGSKHLRPYINNSNSSA